MNTTIIKKLKQNVPPRLGAVWFFTILFALTATNALATLIAYEPFNYTSGGQVNAATAAPIGTPTQSMGGGFTGNWTLTGTAGSFVTGVRAFLDP